MTCLFLFASELCSIRKGWQQPTASVGELLLFFLLLNATVHVLISSHIVLLIAYSTDAQFAT